jgi:type VI protein secretion system component VasK
MLQIAQGQEAIMTRSIAIVLTALLLAVGVAAPAQAQSLRFGIFFGDEASDFFPERFSCLTDYQVRQAVADRGYTNIYLNVMTDKHVQVRATRDGWVYLLDFNYCTGRIEGRTQLRPAG